MVLLTREQLEDRLAALHRASLEWVRNLSSEQVLERIGWDRPDTVISELGVRWHKGRMVLYPADPSLQPKEVPPEVFFHKVVGIRNQLRVLEQKINSHPQLTDGEKIEMQQYISRCYGSLTTFNLLFKNKTDQFDSGSAQR